MYDIRIWEQAGCSKKDRQKIIQVIDLIFGFAHKSRKNGLISLEDDIPSLDSPFMKRGLSLVVDGTDPDTVRHILRTGIYAGRFKGRELLERMVMADGISAIQAGENPDLIRVRLYAYLGEEFGYEKTVHPDETRSGYSNDEPGSPAGTTSAGLPVTEYAATADEAPDDDDPVCMLEIITVLTGYNRVLSMDPASAEEIQSLADAIVLSPSGVDTFINILRTQPASTVRLLLSGFEEYAPGIYIMIKKKWLVFADLAMCDDRSIQKILREVDTVDLCKALKAASPALQDRIFANMSNRAAMLVREDMEFIGPVRIEDVEDAQARILNIARKLEEAGDIIITRPGDRLV